MAECLLGRQDGNAMNSQDEWTAAMMRGDFARAWAISDRILADRIAHGGFDYTLPRHLQAIWDGRPLAGKHVLVRCYHGLGDTIQFVRFAKPLRAIAREVSLWVQPTLKALVANVAGIDRVLPLHDGIPHLAYDVDIEIMELAHALRITPAMLGAHVPYIRSPARITWIDRVTNFRVGLIWAAGDWDPRRSMRFTELAPLLPLPHIEFVVLQRGPAQTEAAPYKLPD